MPGLGLQRAIALLVASTLVLQAQSDDKDGIYTDPTHLQGASDIVVSDNKIAYVAVDSNYFSLVALSVKSSYSPAFVDATSLDNSASTPLNLTTSRGTEGSNSSAGWGDVGASAQDLLSSSVSKKVALHSGGAPQTSPSVLVVSPYLEPYFTRVNLDTATGAFNSQCSVGSKYAIGAKDVLVHVDTAYILTTDNHMEVFDVSAYYTYNCASYLGGYAFEGSYPGDSWTPSAFAVSFPFAYVLSKDNQELKVLNVNNPSYIKQTGSLQDYNYLSSGEAMVIQGSYAYIAVDSAEGVSFGSTLMVIVSLAHTDPQIIGYYEEDEDENVCLGPNSLAVKGKYAYLSCPQSCSLVVVDVTNNFSPKRVGRLNDCDHLAFTSAIALHSNDVSEDPATEPGQSSAPKVAATTPTFVYAVSDIGSSLTVIDVSDPENPHISKYKSVSKKSLAGWKIALIILGVAAFITLWTLGGIFLFKHYQNKRRGQVLLA